MDSEPGPPPDQNDKELLKEFARRIVVAQGNVYIKELLREKQIPIGRTKEDFENNLLKAIDDDIIHREDFEQWLDEVEGWGDQHVYLHNIPPALVTNPIWSSVDTMRKHVEHLEMGSLWDAPPFMKFPATPELTRITFDGNSFQLLWHEGSASWQRAKAKDREEELEGERYKFRAYRWRAWRSVLRFALRLEEKLAAVFISTRIDVPEHQLLKALAITTAEKFLAVGSLSKHEVVVADVIKNLDQALVSPTTRSKPDARTHATQFSSGGAYVEFGSESERLTPWSVAAVRNVRLAILPRNLQQFQGSLGTFEFRRTSTNGLSRHVRANLFGDLKRIRFWARMTSHDVWTILDLIKKYQ